RRIGMFAKAAMKQGHGNGIGVGCVRLLTREDCRACTRLEKATATRFQPPLTAHGEYPDRLTRSAHPSFGCVGNLPQRLAAGLRIATSSSGGRTDRKFASSNKS